MDTESPKSEESPEPEKVKEEPKTKPTEGSWHAKLAEKKASAHDLPSPGHGASVRGSWGLGNGF